MSNKLNKKIIDRFHLDKLCYLRITLIMIKGIQIGFKYIFVLRMPRVTNFDCITKIAAIFIKTSSKDSKKVKIGRIYALKCNI